MAFVNFPLFDNGTAFSDLTVLICDFFLGSYPFSCFIEKYASVGNLEVGRVAEDEGLQQSLMRYAIESGAIKERVYHKEMEAPIEDMKRFLDGILHIYDEGRTAVKMGDLFGIVAEAEARLAEKE